MANIVGICVDGQWLSPPSQPVNPEVPAQQAVVPRTDVQMIDDSEMSDLDKAVAHLGAITRLARYLNDKDALRLREFVHATSAVLAATTRLPGSDQKKFERAIRGGQ